MFADSIESFLSVFVNSEDSPLRKYAVGSLAWKDRECLGWKFLPGIADEIIVVPMIEIGLRVQDRVVVQGALVERVRIKYPKRGIARTVPNGEIKSR